MGITIDEQIKALEHLKKCGIFPFYDTRTGIIITDKYVDGAIDTMRKYQKIEDIVRDYYNEQYTDKLDIEIIEMISEVLEEDGRWE